MQQSVKQWSTIVSWILRLNPGWTPDYTEALAKLKKNKFTIEVEVAKRGDRGNVLLSAKLDFQVHKNEIAKTYLTKRVVPNGLNPSLDNCETHQQIAGTAGPVTIQIREAYNTQRVSNGPPPPNLCKYPVNDISSCSFFVFT